MKRIFTLLILVISFTSGFSQVYRFVGNGNTTPASWTASTLVSVGTRIVAGANVYQCDQAGTTSASGSGPTGTGNNINNGTARFDYISSLEEYLQGAYQNDLNHYSTQITGNGTTGAGFRNASFWRVVTNGVVTATTGSPTSGSTLQFFGKGISIEADVDLSAFNFNIQIRSEYNASIPTTNMALGFIYVDNNDQLTLGTTSTITLGWGVTTGTQRWTPGYLMLFRNANDGSIVRGSTTIATTVGATDGGYYLNAFGYSVTSNAPSANLTASTGTPSSTHIRLIASAPTANLSSQPAALPVTATTPYFARYSYFYSSAAGSPTPVAALPLQLKSFGAQKGNGKISLNWSTVLEINTSHFEVEQSNNAANWKKIAVVAAKGNSNSAQNYSADDIATYSSKVYYRLKMVDADGKFEYSPIAVVTFGAGKGKLTAYPNPAASFTMVSSDKTITENVTVSIYNTTGVLVKQQVIINPGNNFRVGLEDVKQGSYILKINKGSELLEVIKIQKN